MTGHKDKDLIMAFAVEAQTSETPWDIFEESVPNKEKWFECTEQPDWDGPVDHRLKPKTQVIDWSKVNYDIVPVLQIGDDFPHYSHNAAKYLRATLVTGKKIAWTGGECPLPDGVMVRVSYREGEHLATSLAWRWMGQTIPGWFEVTGLADGYSWGVPR
jgi:hypothetical protein